MQDATTQTRTKTQQTLDALGTNREVAEYLSRRLGWTITRQAVNKWHRRGYLPFQMADRYATLISARARRLGFEVSRDELLAEVIVPDHRLPERQAN